MPQEPLKYTFFPWMDALTVGRIIPAAIGVLVAFCIFERVFSKYNNTMRKGTMAIISATAWTVILNFCFYVIAYWKWAIGFSVAMALFFIVILRHELKVAYQDEKEGFRGLNPLIRSIRGEIFSDLSIEEQMEFKESVKPQRFYWYLWLPLVVGLPFLAVLLLEKLGVGDYLFQVVYFTK